MRAFVVMAGEAITDVVAAARRVRNVRAKL